MYRKISGIAGGLVLPAVVALTVAGCTAITEITSSTSSTLDTVTPDITLNRFVDTRIAAIRKEAANGDGEHLDALSELIGEHDRERFSLWMKNNYNDIFNGLSKPTELVSRLEKYRIERRLIERSAATAI